MTRWTRQDSSGVRRPGTAGVDRGFGCAAPVSHRLRMIDRRVGDRQEGRDPRGTAALPPRPSTRSARLPAELGAPGVRLGVAPPVKAWKRSTNRRMASRSSSPSPCAVVTVTRWPESIRRTSQHHGRTGACTLRPLLLIVMADRDTPGITARSSAIPAVSGPFARNSSTYILDPVTSSAVVSQCRRAADLARAHGIHTRATPALRRRCLGSTACVNGWTGRCSVWGGAQ